MPDSLTVRGKMIGEVPGENKSDAFLFTGLQRYFRAQCTGTEILSSSVILIAAEEVDFFFS